jgi:hypothetical protein
MTYRKKYGLASRRLSGKRSSKTPVLGRLQRVRRRNEAQTLSRAKETDSYSDVLSSKRLSSRI